MNASVPNWYTEYSGQQTSPASGKAVIVPTKHILCGCRKRVDCRQISEKFDDIATEGGNGPLGWQETAHPHWWVLDSIPSGVQLPGVLGQCDLSNWHAAVGNGPDTTVNGKPRLAISIFLVRDLEQGRLARSQFHTLRKNDHG